MGLKISKDVKAAETAVEKEVLAEETVATEVAETVIDEENYGVDAGKLAFLNPLGNPANPDTTKRVDANGKEERIVTPTIVGYSFKVLEDMQVPNCGTNEGLKKDPMNYDVIDRWVEAKAGDIINLTPFETALLLSQPGFNGGCNGGECPVKCVYTFKNKKTKTGAVLTADQQAPRVSLRALNGSIKDMQIIDVLTSVKEEGPNGQTKRKNTINPGYEKWAPLAVSGQRRSIGSRSSKTSDRNIANTNAKKFLQFVQSKKA